MTYDTAKRTWDLVRKRFEQFGFPLMMNRQIVPREDDETTNFICAGMQPVRRKFGQLTGEKHGSLQSCVRTNDLSMIGDGMHLTSFEMLGNFQFGGDMYGKSVELWHLILRDLKVKVDYVTVHPRRGDHRQLWEMLGYQVRLDDSCTWSDGKIGGDCCEVFVGGLEVGNLVNTMGHSVDVGFGWERLIQVVEGKERVDQTSLFRQDLTPISSDLVRTLCLFVENNVLPSGKGRGFICRRLLRKLLNEGYDERDQPFSGWLQQEAEVRKSTLSRCRRAMRKRRYKVEEHDWWWQTFGLTPEDIMLFK